MSDLAEVRYID